MVYYSSPTRQRYIIVHPPNYNLFTSVSNVDNAVPEIIMHTLEQDFTIANLTESEASGVRNELKAVKGIVAKDDIINMPHDDIIEIAGNVRVLRSPTTAEAFPYLNDAPKCNAHVDGVDIVVIDTKIYKDIPEFSEVFIAYGQSYVLDTPPCNTHGSRVASVIVGKNAGIITSGDRRIYNPIVFDCNGQGYVWGFISAINEAIRYATENKKNGRQTIINFSGGGSSNPAADAAVMAAVKSGIPTFVAAQNYGRYACNTASPAEVLEVVTVGGTQSPGNAPSYGANFGAPCVDLYLPYTVTVVNVYNNRTTKSSGTSFGSPIAAAFGAIEKYNNPRATPAQVAQNIVARTVTVTPPPGSLFNEPMQVMYEKDACPEPLLFSSYVANRNNANNFTTWYLGINQGPLCVKFSVKSNRWPALIGLRFNETENIIRIRIPGDLIDGNTPADINVRQSLNKTITVMYKKNQQTINLLTLTRQNDMKQVAFSSARGGVTYSNAIRC